MKRAGLLPEQAQDVSHRRTRRIIPETLLQDLAAHALAQRSQPPERAPEKPRLKHTRLQEITTYKSSTHRKSCLMNSALVSSNSWNMALAWGRRQRRGDCSTGRTRAATLVPSRLRRYLLCVPGSGRRGRHVADQQLCSGLNAEQRRGAQQRLHLIQPPGHFRETLRRRRAVG